MDPAGAPPESPDSPSATLAQTLWTSLVNREDIRAIAERLALPPGKPVDSWRLAVLRIARSDDFMDFRPAEVPLRMEHWARWRSLQASPRKALGLLRKLIYGVKIWD